MGNKIMKPNLTKQIYLNGPKNDPNAKRNSMVQSNRAFEKMTKILIFNRIWARKWGLSQSSQTIMQGLTNWEA
jgi:hypothetical protein